MLENLITVMWVYMSSLILIHIPSQTFYFYYFSRENQPAEDRYGDGRINIL